MDLTREVRSALRALAKDTRSTVAAVLTLAIGIGASTAIFSVVYGVLLRPLPYPSPDRIVQVSQIFESGNRGQFSDPNFADVRDRNRSFASLAQYASWMTSVSGTAEPVRVMSATVSREFFDVLRIHPVVGRSFALDELREGGSPAVLVSYAFWQRHLGGSRDLSTTRLTVGGRIYAVVGVLPARFRFPDDAQLWTPRELEPVLPSRTAHNWHAIARLSDDVTVEAARADVSAIARELRDLYGDDTWMVDATAVPLREQIVGRVRPALVVLLGAVGFLLLVASGNVVNLLLARAASRQREVVVKAALGASRWHVIRSALVEAGLLVATGGSFGVLLAVWGVPLLLSLEPGSLPRVDEIGVSFPVLLFALGVTSVISLGLGLLTALRAMRKGRSGMPSFLQERSRSASGAKLRSGLVAAQVALTLVLLVGSGLMARSLFRLLSVDPGFRETDAIVVDLSHPDPSTQEGKRDLMRVQREILGELRALPGVRSAGMIDLPPLTGGFRNGAFLVQTSPDEVQNYEDFGRLMKDPSRVGMAEYRAASAGYFETMGIPLVRGRLFESSDTADSPHICLVSEQLVKEKWPGEDPLGKLIQFGNMDGDLRLMRVVGIVGDIRHGGLDSMPRATIYANARQRPPSTYSVVVDFAGDAAVMTAAAREVVRAIAPDVPPRLRTLEQIVASSIADRRFNAVLLATFGATALLLAVLGIYGVVSYGVTERTREIGLRMALGARPGDVQRMVVGQGSRLIGIGLAAGLLLAFLLTRLLSSLLFGVSATDPLTYALLGAALALVALAACYVPARQASRVDPMVSLRYE